MRICIVGCGAVGSLFAANLATLDDVEVWAFDLSQAHVDAINERGPAADRRGRRRTRGCTPRATPAELPACELGIVATKAMHAESAIAATAHVFADGAVASVMNGVGNEEVLARHVAARDPRHHLPGRQGARARRRAVGRQGRHDVRAVRAAARRARRRSSAWPMPARARGMPAHAVADARPAQWRKVIFNAATNPIGALTGLTHGRVCERPDLRALVSGLVDEGKAVATAQGIELDSDPEALIDHAAKPEVAYDHKASMLQDIEARRRTEIDYLNGGIVSFGARLGVPTPLNETIAALIRGIEASYEGDSLMDLTSELERRYANTRAAMAEHDLDALIVSGQRVHRLRGQRHLPLRLPDRAPLRLRGAARRRRSGHRLPDRGALRRRARDDASSSRSSPTARAPRSRRARRPPAGSASASTGSTTS